LHIWTIMENGFNRNQFFQALHLIPAVYFLMLYKFDVNRSVDQVGKGFFISTVIGFARQFRIWKYLPIEHTTQTVYFFNHGLMIFNRLICLVFLFNAIIIWGMHKSDYRKLMRQTKILYTKKPDSSLVVWMGHSSLRISPHAVELLLTTYGRDKIKFTWGNAQFGILYKMGFKYCDHCVLMMKIDDINCPICNRRLRTKPRGKRRWNGVLLVFIILNRKNRLYIDRALMKPSWSKRSRRELKTAAICFQSGDLKNDW